MAKGYEFMLDKCLLPVTPSKLEVKINNSNKTITLINEGEINILKNGKLSDIEFDCMLPQVEYPFAVYRSKFVAAEYFLNYFEQLKTSKKPFPFIVSRILPDGKVLFGTDVMVSLEDYKTVEDVKNGFDLTIKIKLKQFREYGTKTVKVTIPASTSGIKVVKAAVTKTRETTNSPAPSQNQQYKVVKGDTMWGIAKRFYGDGSKYPTIYKANTATVSNPNSLRIGQVLTIPKV